MLPSSEQQNVVLSMPVPESKKRALIYGVGALCTIVLIVAVAILFEVKHTNVPEGTQVLIQKNAITAPCYVIQQDRVFLTSGESTVSATTSYLVLGADPISFTPLTPTPLQVPSFDSGVSYPSPVCYGKDARHVFFGRSAIMGANQDSFQISSANPAFAKDADSVFRDGMQLGMNINAPTFTMLDNLYGKDAESVYTISITGGGTDSSFGPFVGADPATFVSLGNGYAKDAHAVYAYGGKVPGANPDSFIVPTSTTQFARNTDAFPVINSPSYTYADLSFDPLIDPSTFQPLSNVYAKDALHVFTILNTIPLTATVIAGADPKTFIILGTNPFSRTSETDGHAAKDSQHVYYNGTIVAGADPATFVLLMNPSYGKDATHVFSVWPAHVDTTMLPISSDPADFWDDPDGEFAVDANSVYYEGVKIAGIDKATFVVQNSNGPFYGMDANHVYFINPLLDENARSAGSPAEIMANADRATFTVIDDGHGGENYDARDKNHRYRGNAIVK